MTITYLDLPKYAQINKDDADVSDNYKNIEEIKNTYKRINIVHIVVNNINDADNIKRLMNKSDKSIIDMCRLFLCCIDILRKIDNDIIQTYTELFNDLEILNLLIEEYDIKKGTSAEYRYDIMIKKVISPYRNEMMKCNRLVIENLKGNDLLSSVEIVKKMYG